MKNIPSLPDSYFQKLSNKPVSIKPFDPQSRLVAKNYILDLKNLLREFNVEIIHRGSTAFGIAGKGDIEIGVYPSGKNWRSVISRLKKELGKPGCLEKDYARFNDQNGEFEVEIILQKGQTAKIDLALSSYLLSHPTLLKNMNRLKRNTLTLNENIKYKKMNS